MVLLTIGILYPEAYGVAVRDDNEAFINQVDAQSPQKARRTYIREVIGLFRPGIIRNLTPPTYHTIYIPMLFNYLKVGFRQIWKNALFSSMNTW